MRIAGPWTRMEFDTLFTADSVEWCPTPGLEEVLACGTYQLNEHESRVGSLMLFNWDGKKLTRMLENETSKFSFGILDMKWNNNFKEKVILAAATSGGAVHYFQLQGVKNELNLSDLGGVDLQEEGTQIDGLCLSLSLDWGTQNNVAVSDSLGRVGLVDMCGSGPRLKQLWTAHSYEAWIVCFGHDENMLYSGGDDCKLCQWDTRASTCRPCFTSKWHKMGVCSLQVHPGPGYPHILASGSYDELLALWDVRHMAAPLKEKPLGGGVWRIKWNQHSPNLAAAACMHNHFTVVDTHLDSAEPVEVLKTYKDHKSLAYGIDWCRKHISTDNQHVFTLASCSFYDHSMHLWTMTL